MTALRAPRFSALKRVASGDSSEPTEAVTSAKWTPKTPQGAVSLAHASSGSAKGQLGRGKSPGAEIPTFSAPYSGAGY